MAPITPAKAKPQARQAPLGTIAGGSRAVTRSSRVGRSLPRTTMAMMIKSTTRPSESPVLGNQWTSAMSGPPTTC